MALGHAVTGRTPSIYVERHIHAPLEAVWEHTQDPTIHERWDLRFTEIDYLPRDDPSQPQRFRYATRLGFGIGAVGTGESVTDRSLTDGSRVSSLRFGSDQARSLIREGRGYWKYVPTSDGVTFLTSYDYDTRYGRVGRIFDRLVFRPLIGWATAWSFDRLRLWLEDGIDPGRSARRALVHGLARVSLAAIFAWQGLLPKLLGPDSRELVLTAAAGVPTDWVRSAVVALGVLELVFAVVLIAAWHRAWPPYAALAFAIGATVVLLLSVPADQRPVDLLSLNGLVAALAIVDRWTLAGIPSAGRCRRQPTADPTESRATTTREAPG